MTASGLQSMVSGLAIKQFYAAGDAVEPAAAEKALLPKQFVSFDAAHAKGCPVLILGAGRWLSGVLWIDQPVMVRLRISATPSVAYQTHTTLASSSDTTEPPKP